MLCGFTGVHSYAEDDGSTKVLYRSLPCGYKLFSR